jgi:hypothetical protein
VTEPQALTSADSDVGLCSVLAQFPHVPLALVFGLVAKDPVSDDSDLAVAVALVACIPWPSRCSVRFGNTACLSGSKAATPNGSRHLVEARDFLPLRNRILKEGRKAWIGNSRTKTGSSAP